MVNKPAGMVVHAGAGVASGTLVNALLYRLGKLSAEAGVVRPGIVPFGWIAETFRCAWW